MTLAAAVPATPPTAVPAVVRAATPADLPAAAAHMRRVLARDLGGYDPRLHADVDDLAGAYLAWPDRALYVAVLDGLVAGTASVRPGGPRPDLVPARLAARYADVPVGQVCRVWVDAAHRRSGLGRALGLAAARGAFALGYDPVCLHTDAAVPGALAFWRGFPGAVEVFDARPDPWSTVHFEIDRAAVARE